MKKLRFIIISTLFAILTTNAIATKDKVLKNSITSMKATEKNDASEGEYDASSEQVLREKKTTAAKKKSSTLVNTKLIKKPSLSSSTMAASKNKATRSEKNMPLEKTLRGKRSRPSSTKAASKQSTTSGNSNIKTLYPRCEFYHRFDNTSIFPNDLDHVHTYTRSTSARYVKGNNPKDGSGVKFVPSLLTVEEKGDSLSAHTGGFASPYVLESYFSNIESEKYAFDDTIESAKLYNEIILYKLDLCKGIAKSFTEQLNKLNLDKSNLKPEVYCSNNYPNLLIRFTPKTAGKKPTETFYKMYNHLLMAYFIAIVNYNAYSKGISIEMVIRSSFGHNNPTIDVTDKSFRINIGLVPEVYAGIIVTSLIQLYELFLKLEVTEDHLEMDKILKTRLEESRGLIKSWMNESDRSKFDPKLPDTYWDTLWVQGSCGQTGYGHQFLYEMLQQTQYGPELLANFVLDKIIEEEKKNPGSFFNDTKIAEAPMESIFNLVEYYKKNESYHIRVNSESQLRDYGSFDSKFNEQTNSINKRISEIDDKDFKGILEQICKGLGIGLYDNDNLTISNLYKFFESAHINFICKKRTRSKEQLDKISDWGSDSETDEENVVNNKSVFAKKVIVANGMLAINLAYYASRSAIAFINAFNKTKGDSIESLVEEYNRDMELEKGKVSEKIKVDCKNTYYEVKYCLSKAIQAPKTKKTESHDILFFDLNSFNSKFIAESVYLETKLKATKPIVVVLDHTSSTTDQIGMAIESCFQESSVYMVLLVTSGLKNEQGGADNNPYGKLTILSLGNKKESRTTLTDFIYKNVTDLTSESAEIKLNSRVLIPKKAHAIRHSYKDRGFTTTTKAILNNINKRLNSNVSNSSDLYKTDDRIEILSKLTEFSKIKKPKHLKRSTTKESDSREDTLLYKELVAANSEDQVKKLLEKKGKNEICKLFIETCKNKNWKDAYYLVYEYGSSTKLTIESLTKGMNEIGSEYKIKSNIKKAELKDLLLNKISKLSTGNSETYNYSQPQFSNYSQSQHHNQISNITTSLENERSNIYISSSNTYSVHSSIEDDNAIFQVLNNNNIDELKNLLSTKPALIKKVDGNEENIFLIACRNNNVAVVEYLLENFKPKGKYAKNKLTKANLKKALTIIKKARNPEHYQKIHLLITNTLNSESKVDNNNSLPEYYTKSPFDKSSSNKYSINSNVENDNGIQGLNNNNNIDESKKVLVNNDEDSIFITGCEDQNWKVIENILNKFQDTGNTLTRGVLERGLSIINSKEENSKEEVSDQADKIKKLIEKILEEEIQESYFEAHIFEH